MSVCPIASNSVLCDVLLMWTRCPVHYRKGTLSNHRLLFVLVLSMHMSVSNTGGWGRTKGTKSSGRQVAAHGSLQNSEIQISTMERCFGSTLHTRPDNWKHISGRNADGDFGSNPANQEGYKTCCAIFHGAAQSSSRGCWVLVKFSTILCVDNSENIDQGSRWIEFDKFTAGILFSKSFSPLPRLDLKSAFGVDVSSNFYLEPLSILVLSIAFHRLCSCSAFLEPWGQFCCPFLRIFGTILFTWFLKFKFNLNVYGNLCEGSVASVGFAALYYRRSPLDVGGYMFFLILFIFKNTCLCPFIYLFFKEILFL